MHLGRRYRSPYGVARSTLGESLTLRSYSTAVDLSVPTRIAGFGVDLILTVW